MVQKIFFQSSLPRAGSTLLQNVMGQNPDFYVTPTSGVLELVYAARANYTSSPEFKAQDTQLMREGFLNFCNQGVQGFFNAVTDKPVRDLRGIFASMEKNFRKNQHMDSGIVNHAQMQGTTTEKRIDIWAQSQPVGLAIERLHQIFKEGNNQKMLFVKFEDFSSNPKKEMERIYQYLELPYYEHDFNNVQQITQEDDSVYGIYGDHKIKSRIEPLKPDYKEILGVNASNWIKSNYQWFYDQFGYF